MMKLHKREKIEKLFEIWKKFEKEEQKGLLEFFFEFCEGLVTFFLKKNENYFEFI
jgi:hypothetical protein